MKNYLAAAESKKCNVPGSGYFGMLDGFAKTHCELGELYFEYRHSSCRETSSYLCDFCQKNPIQSPPKRTRQPYPDYTRLPEHHYRNWNETPTEGRFPDDFQPRAQIKILFEKGELNCADLDDIKSFSKKYIVSEKLVYEYIQHLTMIKLRKDKRLAKGMEKRKARSEREHDDIDWRELYETDKISSLLVRELRMYLDHHGLSHEKRKTDNVRIVKAHIGSRILDEMEKGLGRCSCPLWFGEGRVYAY